MPKAIIDIETLTGIGDAVREKVGSAEGIPVPALENAIREIPSGGGSAGVSAKAVNFYDYEGTILHSYTKDEFLALTEMPELPTRPGLICQGWNNTLEYMQEYTSEYGTCDAGATYITDDGATRIYITLHEGRTSPILGLGIVGNTTIDWGDGTEPYVLTGTNPSRVTYTSKHEYAKPGDYVIRLTVNAGSIMFLGASTGSWLLTHSTSDSLIRAYPNSINRVEIGSGVTTISDNAFQLCYSLASISIPNGVTIISDNAFQNCYSLGFVNIPRNVRFINSNIFRNCQSLGSVSIPSSVTTISGNAFCGCHSLGSVSIPSSVTTISGNAFQLCYSLASVSIPSNVGIIDVGVFQDCYCLASVSIPSSVTNIGNGAFRNCFASFFDFPNHSVVPTLSNTNAFTGIPADCEIRVPAALYDEWIAATNWSTYAANIVAV
jgi:hypothetical protein